MGDDGRIEIHIPAVLGSEKEAMEKAAEVARRMGFSADRVEDLKTAVAEACTNAIEHGSGGEGTARIGVSLTVGESALQVDVRDSGRGVGGEVPEPSIEQGLEGGSTRGWGIFLIRELMDDVRFETRPEGGNVVKMIIYLEPKEDGGEEPGTGQ